MQKSRLVEARNSWSELANRKAFRFFQYLLQSRSLIRPILLLDDEYVTTAEARLLGVTKITHDLIFHGIVERYDTTTTRMWKLTPLGLEVKKKLLEILDILEEAL